MVKTSGQSESTASVVVARILTAAQTHFARFGFAGARVEDIAQEAGVNKATLYYQVGDKAALYHAVVADVLKKTANAVERAANTTLSPQDQLTAYVTTLAGAMNAQPHLAPILLREVASGGAQLSDDLLQPMLRIMGRLRALLEDGARRGEFRCVDPLTAHILIVGGILFYVGGAPLRARVATLGSGVIPKTGSIPIARIAETVLEMVMIPRTANVGALLAAPRPEQGAASSAPTGRTRVSDGLTVPPAASPSETHATTTSRNQSS